MIQVLPFLNNPKDLEPSYKMDLDFGINYFGRKKLCCIIEELWYMAKAVRIMPVINWAYFDKLI